MANSISLYPTYDIVGDKVIIDILPYQFSYEERGKVYDLHVVEKSNKITIEDPRNVWTKDNNNLTVSGSVNISSGSNLYGPEGIACKDAKIGVALSWHSHDSNQRNVSDIGSIENKSNNQVLDFSCTFGNGTFRGSLTLEIILYIKSPGKPKSNELFFANKPGLLLGCVDSYTLSFDGNGSIFPIYEESVPGEPLWRVKCDFADAENDSFDENVYIYLNKAHDCYKYIDIQNPSLNIEFLAEIIGDAMATVVETVRSQDSDFSCLSSPQEGSVAQALLFFQTTLGWDLSKPEVATQSIRKYLERQLKRNK